MKILRAVQAIVRGRKLWHLAPKFSDLVVFDEDNDYEARVMYCFAHCVEYYKAKGLMPTKVTLEYLLEQSEDEDAPNTSATLFASTIYDIYLADMPDKDLIEDEIVKLVLESAAKDLVKAQFLAIKDGAFSMKSFTKAFQQLSILDSKGRSISLLEMSAEAFSSELPNRNILTFSDKLNKSFTNFGLTPKHLGLIISKTKSGKSFVLRNIAKAAVMAGLNVYYADAENGLADTLMGMATVLYGKSKETLASGSFKKSVDKAILSVGGNIVLASYEPYKSFLSDVEADIKIALETYGLQRFDLIILDPVEKLRVDTTMKAISYDNEVSIYAEAEKMLSRLDAAGLTQCQVKSEFFYEKRFTSDMLYYGAAKVFAAQFVLAYNTTPKERKARIGRLSLPENRWGTDFVGDEDYIFIKFDVTSGVMTEISPQEASALYKNANDEDYEFAGATDTAKMAADIKTRLKRGGTVSSTYKPKS